MSLIAVTLRWRGRTMFAATLISLAAVTVAEAAESTCAWPQNEALPDAQRCMREVLVAEAPTASATVAGGVPAVDKLLARSDARRAADDLAGAGSALACAAAQIVDDGDLRPHYEVIRRLGILEYGRDRPVEALASFECALRLAQELDDRGATAKQLKNVGSSLRRIGDYAGAMRALTRSLQMQRDDDDAAIGPVLNNIADVYRDLEQREEAERYYREALAAFRASGDYVQVMHVYDSLSELALDRRDPNAATALLETALRDLRALEGHAGVEGARRYQMMILAGLARAAIADGDVARARIHIADALGLADEHALPLPAELQLEAARTDRLSGRYAPAIARLNTALAARPEAPGMHAALLRELSLTLEQSGRAGEALAALREAYERDASDLRAQRDRGLAWSNARFNLSESRRRLAAAEQESRRRALMLWLSLASAVAALSLLSVFFIRRQQRAREAEAVRHARYEEALAHYRREADALVQDRQLLQALFDSRTDALALLDADGQMLAVNRAACALLRIDRLSVFARPVQECFAEADAAALTRALENMEDAPSQRLILSFAGEGPSIHAELRQWEGGDGLIVISLAAQEEVDATPMQSELSGRAIEDRTAPTPTREEFRRALVELMLAVVDAWERSTGENRIELAQRSRIWRVGIDDGRLRARAMERYLSLSKLPQNPRWRDVLRSAYYVLGQCEKMPAKTRDDLQRRIDMIVDCTRHDALV